MTPEQKARADSDPVSRIEWRHVDTLQANSYNPNRVFAPELKLLELSILRQGWMQPILCSRDGVIIDGFHRTELSRQSEELRARYGGFVPCVVLDLSEAEAMCLTVRINRAKGSHSAIRMSAIVKDLIDRLGMTPELAGREMGMHSSEVDVLYQDSIFAMKKTADYRFAKAWTPAQDGGTGVRPNGTPDTAVPDDGKVC